MHQSLTPEQREEYEAAEAERRKSRHAAKVRLFVAILEQSCPLKSTQRDAMVELLLKETRPALRSSEYDWYVVIVQAAKIPDSKLKPILDQAQLTYVKKITGQARGMEGNAQANGRIARSSKLDGTLIRKITSCNVNTRNRLLLRAMVAVVAAIVGNAAPCPAQPVQEHIGEVVPRDVREMYDRGLQYLVKTQNDAGGWSGGEDGPGVTGMCLMAFLASGEDPNFGLYSKQVRKAVKNIILGQTASTGYLGNSMYHHGFGMLALAEAYGTVDDRNFWTAADKGKGRSIGAALELAVRAAITSQKKNSYGGWRYTPDSNDADTSVSGAVLVGLLAARNAGIEVPDEVIDRAISYYQSMTSNSGQVAYSGGLGGFDESLARISIGSLVYSIARRKDLPQYKATIEYLKQRPEQPANGYREYACLLRSPSAVSGRPANLGKVEQNARASAQATATTRRQLHRRLRPSGRHFAVAVGAGIKLSLPAHLRTLNDAQRLPTTRLVDREHSTHAAPPFAQSAETPPVAPTSAGAMLYLNDGDYFSGRLRDCPTANTLRWQASGATGPFEFDARMIRSAYFAPPQKRPAPDGEYCIELSNGDVLYGSLAAITKDDFEIESAQFGHLKIARSEIHRLTPVASASFVYRGPNNLAEWTSDDISNWREEAGRFVTNKRGASIKKSIAIPEQAHFEFEIAWNKSPQFTLAFCAGDKAKQLTEGFKIEVWGRKLVLVREMSKSADVASLGELDSNTARVHLEATYNHATGEFAVQSLDGHELGKITLPKQGGYPLRVVQLTNRGAEVSLEQLAVSQWNGQSPQKVDVEQGAHPQERSHDHLRRRNRLRRHRQTIRRQLRGKRNPHRQLASRLRRAVAQRQAKRIRVSHRATRWQPLQRRPGQS